MNNHEDRWSEHGLGHLLNPADPDADDPAWIAQVWTNLVRSSLNLSIDPLGFDSLPVIGRLAISSPPLLQPLAALNARKSFPHQVKPFNFLSTCHVRELGHPTRGVDPTHFHLIAPYERDARRWLSMPWTDRYSGKRFGIRTTGDCGDRQTARVQTYGDVVEAYAYHPEAKCAGAHGEPCGKQTVGLLQRRHITIGEIHAIGKESNSLEEVQSGVEHDEASVYTEYFDSRRDAWTTKTWPAVKRARLVDLERECKDRVSRRALIDIRAGRSRPHARNQAFLASVVRKLGLL